MNGSYQAVPYTVQFQEILSINVLSSADVNGAIFSQLIESDSTSALHVAEVVFLKLFYTLTKVYFIHVEQRLIRMETSIIECVHRLVQCNLRYNRPSITAFSKLFSIQILQCENIERKTERKSIARNVEA